MKIVIREAAIDDAHTVSAILSEAAAWLEARGVPLWTANAVSVAHIRDDVASGLYVLAEADGRPAGTLKYQMEDPLFWPEASHGEASYVHRLAVKREYAGGLVSLALLKWAVDRTEVVGRPYLRLDCDASRPKLRQLYEGFGFQYHSETRVHQFNVARYEYVVPRKAP